MLAIPPQAFPRFAAAQASGTFTDCTDVSVMAGVDIPTRDACGPRSYGPHAGRVNSRGGVFTRPAIDLAAGKPFTPQALRP
ncbi:hypothetical protein SO3561_08487 [Streptomyces olivochromogenes]|uniref:Uncharacterized protein n=1 Tax=Streptomyces olivochromogenes TaxID=1963 RepID=A0A250VS47_STROL|nr:hypothetical protein SO3561_08487 [Streptomyces olivochromogenes]